MATKYWYRGAGGTAAWNSQSSPPNYDNWWDNEAHTVPAAALPANGDYLVLLGPTAPSTGPGGAVIAAGFDSRRHDGELGMNVTGNITIAGGGFLRMGGGDSVQYWSGDAGGSGREIDLYRNVIVVAGVEDARFHDDSQQLAGSIVRLAKFFGTHLLSDVEDALELFEDDLRFEVFGDLSIVRTDVGMLLDARIDLCSLSAEVILAGTITPFGSIVFENHLDEGVAIKNG